MQQFVELISRWQSIVEILILATVIYYLYLQFRGTRGARAFIAFAIAYLVAFFLSSLLGLEVIESLLRGASFFVALALVVVFQPELRRAITQLANYDFFVPTSEKRETLDLIADVAQALADRRFGALIAIERDMSLAEIAETGVHMDSELSMELALTIFHPKTALHDGGLIMHGDRVEAAGCIYPVTQREFSDRSIGLRHRAAMGLSEEFDAVVIAVSEETGNISIFHGGKMERALPRKQFRRRLDHLLLNAPDSEDDDEDDEDAEGESPPRKQAAPQSFPGSSEGKKMPAGSGSGSHPAVSTPGSTSSRPDSDSNTKASSSEAASKSG